MNDLKKRQSRKVGVAGGFINQVMGNNCSVPVVGEGATVLSYSDRHAYEVIEVNEDRTECVIRPMDCKFVGNGYGDERYEYSSNEKNKSMKVEWNEKKKCWGKTWKYINIIKSLRDKLIKEYGFKWAEHLPVPYNEIVDGVKAGVYTKYKLVKGVTKEYKEFHKISIIFGVMEEYRDPSF